LKSNQSATASEAARGSPNSKFLILAVVVLVDSGTAKASSERVQEVEKHPHNFESTAIDTTVVRTRLSAGAWSRTRKILDQRSQFQGQQYPRPLTGDNLAQFENEVRDVCRELGHCTANDLGESHIAILEKFAIARREANEQRRSLAHKTSELIDIDDETERIDGLRDRLNLIKWKAIEPPNSAKPTSVNIPPEAKWEGLRDSFPHQRSRFQIENFPRPIAVPYETGKPLPVPKSIEAVPHHRKEP
jgi:hypothetical protein